MNLVGFDKTLNLLDIKNKTYAAFITFCSRSVQ